MAKVKTARAYDPAEFLDSPEVVSEYLTEAFKIDDEVLIAKAIGAVARAVWPPLLRWPAYPGKTSIARSAATRGRNLRPFARCSAHSAFNW
jgi:hypothetical protein